MRIEKIIIKRNRREREEVVTAVQVLAEIDPYRTLCFGVLGSVALETSFSQSLCWSRRGLRLTSKLGSFTL